jgi:hypothetical protein
VTHDIDTRDRIIADLSSRLDAAEAEVAQLKAHTWQRERAAVARWLWSSGNGLAAIPIER